MLEKIYMEELNCAECGQKGMNFWVKDVHKIGIYGTLICSRCGYEEIYTEYM